MAEIIDMDNRRPLSQKAKAAIRKKRKILAVQKVFHCTRCHRKCEKCGTQIDVKTAESEQHLQLRVPYQLCGSCSEEYADYVERLKGGGDAECYWRNDDWIESWQRWIDYRGALDRFVRSKEFTKLLKELQETIP
jgi:hypothetical protein